MPFSTWLLKGYFDTIPIELEEQAMIDGCSRLQSLLKVILPLSVTGIAAVAIFIFLEAWSEFMMALTIVTQDELRPLSVKLVTLIGVYRTDRGPAMAYSVLITLPVVLLFVLLQRLMVGGLTAGFSK